MTDVPGADTAIGGEKFPDTVIEGERLKHRRETYRRTCQHYVTNNNASIAPTVTVRANSDGAIQTPTAFSSDYYADIDQGWVNIPFMNSAMSMDQSDWDEIQCGAARLRFVDCGFTIERMQCMQQTVSTISSTTTVTNQFTQAPAVMLFKDDDHSISTMATTGNPASTALMDLGTLHAAPGIANKAFPGSFNGGLLPNVHILQPCSAGTVNMNAETSFDLQKGGHVTYLQSGNKYTYKWTNPDMHRWMSPMLVGNNEFLLTDETTKQTGFYAPNLFGTFLCAIMPNLATNVNRNLVDIPHSHMMRVPPSFNPSGPIIINMEMLVTYFMTIEWIPGRYLTSRYLLGNDLSILPTNYLPMPNYKRILLANGPENPVLPTDKEKGKKSDSKQPAKRKAADTESASAKRVPVIQYADQHDGRTTIVKQKTTRYHIVEDDDDEVED